MLGVTTLVTEGCLFGYNCFKAQKKYKAALKPGESDEDLKRLRNKEIKEAACEVSGATIGSIALGVGFGSFIPGVGTMIGALIGNAVGRLLGNIIGRLIF